ncbi:DUF4179 domain-containing protein [Cohnella sp. AR92]|uniref:DUF4179 domain-containing protein n=1 Tax=Cohnella sp. AR92 TaxID=648716 RepID=UPI000F8E2E3B|nr:DUF4179 domain-containing protein [Cohnella sp. AR92]RUS45934.1 DUF4179 domain-containing protein [Cohnella sp. AR92]
MLEEEKEELERMVAEQSEGEQQRTVEPSLEESPLDAKLSEAIRAGIRAGKGEQRRRRRSSAKRWISIASAGVIVLASLLSIRVSPVFAAMVRDIPGLERFVELIENGDRGVRYAIENEYYQPLGLSQEIDGRTFTVQGMVVDEARMVVFYELRNSDKEKPLELISERLRDQSGKEIRGMYGGHQPDITQEKGQNVVTGTIDIWQEMNRNGWPEEVELEVKTLAVQSAESAGTQSFIPARHPELPSAEASLPPQDDGPSFRVAFSIDPDSYKDKKQEIPIGQAIEAEGQRIEFEKAVLSPLRVTIYLSYDENNSKQVLDSGDLKLVDDTGEVWGGWIDKTHQVYYFENNYFNRPKKLSLEGSWFRAIDKDKMTVTVDLDKQKLLEAPDDRLKLSSVGGRGSGTRRLTFSLSGVAPDDAMSYSIMNEFTDATGTENTTKGSGTWHQSGVGEQSSYYDIEDKPYVQPLTFKVFSYPSYIRQEYRIPLW